MRLVSLGIIAIIFFSLVLGADDRRLGPNGEEMITKGTSQKRDEVWGHVPVPDSYHELVKTKNGKVILTTRATIDKDGFRVSSNSHKKGKKKHLFLIDSSSIFGQGLNDDETLGHIINGRSKTYEAYTLAFYGYGPQHAWLRFKEGKLSSVVKEKTGRAIVFTHEEDFSRFFGSLYVMSYVSNYPHVVETQPGVFELAGNFGNSGEWWQQAITKICNPFLFCRGWLTHFRKIPTPDQYVVMERLWLAVEKMYREQFDVENFTLVWTGEGDYALEQVRKYTHMNIVHMPKLPRLEDGHPVKGAMQALSDFLFSEGIIPE